MVPYFLYFFPSSFPPCPFSSLFVFPISFTISDSVSFPTPPLFALIALICVPFSSLFSSHFLVSFFSLTTFFPICFPSFFPISWFPLFSSLFHFHRLPYCLSCFPPYLLRMFSPISVPMLVLCSSPFPSHFLPSDWVVSSSFFPFLPYFLL